LRARALAAAAAAAAACHVPAAGGQRAPRPGIDVLSYGFQIMLPDTGSAIAAQAMVVFRRTAEAPDTLALDLVGFTVDSVGSHDGARAASFARLPFAYDGSMLRIALPQRRSDAPENVSVFYHGAPRDGLIIRTDARGRRSAFGDNWPDRARGWLPTVDSPADKAEVLWLVSAPQAWRVVANGRLARQGRSPDGRTWWAYEEHRPIPTYTMVIGAAPFTVSRRRPLVRGRDTVPIEVWTYPEDSAWADSVPFRRVTRIVETLQDLVGPFPYEKLAHVESATRYGGMENSAAIFYADQGYVTRRMGEAVVRHETAHQWFGDAVTERDFHHLWLSEGFATYLDLVVGSALDGDSVLARGMRDEAVRYMSSRDVDRPVIDSSVTLLTRLLNTNSYNKGAWVLHMLRGQLGDSVFWLGIREYYRRYRDSSVTSEDFERVMERASGLALGWFFTEWLRQPGYPELDVTWRADTARGRVALEVRQAQPDAWGRYAVRAVPVEFRRAGRVVGRRSFDLKPQVAPQVVSTVLEEVPDAIVVDPDGKLLMTARVRP
jgi:aminopeptidase N